MEWLTLGLSIVGFLLFGAWILTLWISGNELKEGAKELKRARERIAWERERYYALVSHLNAICKIAHAAVDDDE